MKNKMLAVFALAALGSATHAAVVVTVIDKGTPFNSTTTATGYHGVVIRLSSNSGNISAVDLTAAGLNSGSTPTMVQRWTDPDSPDGTGSYTTKSLVNAAQNSSANNANLDSHFLPPAGDAANMLIGSALNENATFGSSGSQLALFPANNANTGYGLGTFITGAFGIVGSVQSPTLDLLYLVLPDYLTVTVGVPAPGAANVQVATAGGTFTVPMAILPEPASLTLAAAGAIGLITRRRRSQ